MKKGYKDLLAEAEALVEAVDTSEAARLLASDNVLFVDLRDPREREREGTIPNAFPCPRGMLEFWIDPDSPYHKPVFAEDKLFLFFCASGWRSALATRTAMEMGLETVCHLDGGFSAWREAGLAVEPVVAKAKT
jgi:rhodanese-related sulfurtransferase